MRIATGGICHETSTFANTRTTVESFASGFGLFRGGDIIERFRGANTCTGGFIDGAERLGFELVPLVWGFAYPSGLILADEYAALKQEFLDRLQHAGPIDGVLLDQHGAMVVEGIEDADGDFIAAVREAVGPKCPVIVTFDLHGNHTLQRCQAATAVIGFDTYPHIDMAERGLEAANMMVATLSGQIRPVVSFKPIPLFWSAACQITAHPPMDEVLRQVHALEQRPGILSVTISTGFPWADIENMGASVIVVADRDMTLAEQTANELVDWVWQRRERWHRLPVSVSDALAQGEAIGKYPIILADQADNTGGGAGGDSTEILRTFLERRMKDSLLLYIVDSQVARQAHVVGVGGALDIDIGGKSDPGQGLPVKMHAKVRGISNGAFTYDGPMFAGLTGNMGCSAWLEQDGVHVVIVTAAEQPLGPAFGKTLGIDCRSMRVIAVKSAVHFRASFEPMAGSIFNVDTQAVHTHDFTKLKYNRRRRPMYPIDGL